MTPREVQLTIRADADRRLDQYDILAAAAWQGARLGRARKLPKMTDVFAERDKGRGRPRTMDEDIARMQGWFGRLRRGRVH